MSTQMRAESQRRVNSRRRPVPTALEMRSLKRSYKGEDRLDLWQVNSGKMVRDTEKIFHQNVNKTVQEPGFQPLTYFFVRPS